MTTPIGILGTGGQSSEVTGYLGGQAAFYAVSASLGEPDSVDIAEPPQELLDVPVVAAVGAPAVRRLLVGAWPGTVFHTVVAPGSYIGTGVELGAGCVIAPGAVLTAGIVLGEHVLVNAAATIGHDTTVGSFATISPGVNIGGGCTIGAGVLLGIGATVREGVTLADGVVVGAGAVVLADVAVPNAVVVGVPARQISINADWADAF